MKRKAIRQGYRVWACSLLWLCAATASAQQAPAAASGKASATFANPYDKPASKDEVIVGASHNPRAQNTWFGSSGGLQVIDGSSGEVGTLRLALGFDYFRASEFLVGGDTNEWLGGVLSLSAAVLEHLEIFGSLSSHSNSNNRGSPVLLQVAGDTMLGAKGYYQLFPWLSVGADARLLFLNTVGDLGISLSGTSLGLRGAATADLRHLAEPVPVIVRGNLGYLLDNSSRLVESVEDARYDALPPATRREQSNEDRNLINRIERFGLGVNRVDRVQIALGIEAPLSPMKDLFVHPLLEWRLDIPVNRQGYSCLSVPTNAGTSGQDGCLAITGLSAAPSSLTIGARVFPFVPGLSAMLGLDIGLLGTNSFVRELAPNRSWAFYGSVGYAIDTRKPAPEIRVLETPALPPPAATNKQRLRGQVVERGFGTAVAGAIVHYADHDELNPQVAGSDGRFISYELAPGEVVLEVTHPDYEAGRCVGTIPKPGPIAPPSRFQPAAPSGGAAAAAPSSAELRCELTAKPRAGRLLGTVTGDDGAPVSGATVQVTGPAPSSATTDAGGTFTLEGLPPGEYSVRVDAPDYMLKVQPFTLERGADTNLTLGLVKKPKTSQVTLTAKEVRIGAQVMFAPNSADLDPRSNGLLSEVADVLQRNPQVRVQVQGHTDNQGDPEQNQLLSQQRAEAVVQYLVGAGVDSSRLEAKGYGDSRPIVPNLTPANRATNRRVQFVIK